MDGSELGFFGQLSWLLDRGGPLMIPIGLCSVLGIAVVIERILYLIWTHENPAEVYEHVANLTRAGRTRDALQYCQSQRGALARTLGAGLTQFRKERRRLEETLAVAGQEQLTRIERRLRALEVMATISPLLGLLGTVTGMIRAFRQVAAVQGTVSPALLASGIWEALLTTAAGLMVAIPLMIFLHYFERKREKIGLEIEKYASLFVHVREDLAEAQRGPAPAERKATG
jgi:biopolymer transport protein ExbB